MAWYCMYCCLIYVTKFLHSVFFTIFYLTYLRLVRFDRVRLSRGRSLSTSQAGQVVCLLCKNFIANKNLSEECGMWYVLILGQDQNNTFSLQEIWNLPSNYTFSFLARIWPSSRTTERCWKMIFCWRPGKRILSFCLLNQSFFCADTDP